MYEKFTCAGSPESRYFLRSRSTVLRAIGSSFSFGGSGLKRPFQDERASAARSGPAELSSAARQAAQ